MDDFKLNIEVKVTVKPVNPKVGLEKRGPYERNLFVVQESQVSSYVGEKTDIATLVANAVKVISDEHALSAQAPPSVDRVSSNVTGTTTATVSSYVDANSVSTTITCYYSTDPKDLSSTQVATESPLSGADPAVANMPLTGLTADTQYYYRVRVQSAAGDIYSELKSFKTNAA